MHELEGVPTHKAAHLLKPLDRDQSGQPPALPLDADFIIW
jgi:hypothetical protein